MTVTFRPHLAEIPCYLPGRATPGAIKLSSNELSCPIPQAIQHAIAEAAAGINRYPDNDAVTLTDVLATHLGIDPRQVLLGPGSAALCQSVIAATAGPGESVLFGWRSFEAYPILTAAVGAASKQVPLAEDGRIDLVKLADSMTSEVRAVFICTPNNPTGPTVSEAEFAAFYECVPHDLLIVLDEAYREFVTDRNAVDGLAWAVSRPNVLCLRTLSKAYAMAGLRLGYACGSGDLLDELRKMMVPFSVNSLAQAAGIAALASVEEFKPYWAQVIAERGRVIAALRVAGYQVPDSQANFLWLPTGVHTAELATYFTNHGILVRPFPGDGIRVTIGTPEENDAFLAVATSADESLRR